MNKCEAKQKHKQLFPFTCMYVYVYMCVCVCVYIYIYNDFLMLTFSEYWTKVQMLILHRFQNLFYRVLITYVIEV
jgi:hypothetical protein